MKKYIPIIDEKDVDAFLSVFRNITLAEVKTAKHDQLGDFEILTVRTKYPIIEEPTLPVMDSVTPIPALHE